MFDLFCGLGGWSESFIAEGYQAIGFDIEAHDYGNGGYPGELVLRDIRSITGAELVKQYGIPACIVASPPCQEFSYMAMPWTKAKEKERKILTDPQEQKRLTDLFNQCFRIQREVSEASGCYVPIVIENVRGAQKWVGKARLNFGSFYLWGDVPALIPIPAKIKLKTTGPLSPNQSENHNCHINEMRDALKGEGNKTAAGKQAMEGTKLRDEGYDYDNRSFGWKAPPTSSKSKARKQASAEIAKIPSALAQWIAKCLKPKDLPCQKTG